MKTKCLLLVALILVPIFAPFLVFVPKAGASSGEANVYILELSNVPAYGVNSQTQIQIGAINACLPTGSNIQFNVPSAHPKRSVDYPPYYQAVPEVITAWSTYEQIVLNSVGAIIVNTHGAYLPVPNDYNKMAWVDKIAESMSTRRLSWIHCGGYAFYKVYYENGANEGDWTELVNGKIIGAGFRRLMSNIGIQDADLLTPIGVIHHPDRTTTFAGDGYEPAISWDFNPHFEAPVGNPLRCDQFEQYMAFPLFSFVDTETGLEYLPGASVSFSKVNQRYESNYGAGVYVHLGIGSDFTDGVHSGDYLKGLLGTAAAVCSECWNCQGKVDSYSHAVGDTTIQNGTLVVQPLLSRVYYTDDNKNLTIDLVFPIYGSTQSLSDLYVPYQSAYFLVEPSGNEWQDVFTNVHLSGSKEGIGYSSPVLSGFGGVSLLAAGIMWFLSVPTLLAAYPVAQCILWGLGGIRLAASWADQRCMTSWGGIDGYDHYSEFVYDPQQTITTNGGTTYFEFMTFTKVTVKIPKTAGRSGWLTFPLHYTMNATPSWTYDSHTLSVDDTLPIAVWFDGSGQNDSGSNADAGNTIGTATPAIPNAVSHGYLFGQGGDSEDWYSVSFSDGNKKGVYADMTPPRNVDIDVQLYNSTWLPVASSSRPAGQAECAMTYSNLTGPWYFRIYPGSDPNSVGHSGVYSFSLSYLECDIKLDKVVDIYDAIILAGAFNSAPGSLNWNSNADINNDNHVDIYDAIILANNFNKNPPVGGYSAQGSPMGGPGMGAFTMLGAGAGIAVDPSQSTVFKGQTFVVNVMLSNVNDLHGWQLKLYWNSTVINCTNATVVTPTVWQGYTQDYGPGIEANYNSTHARFYKAEAAKYPAPSFNGSTTIATLTFQATETGATSLSLQETKLGNSTADPIDHTESSGSVSVCYGRYMRSDTQQVNGLSAYKLGIPQSASSAVNTQSGSGAGAMWGIRAWVRHSNGVEQEISLDGQTGTPEATVGGGWAGIRSSTVSVAQTALQSTDSLVVRVYVQIEEGPWNLCATFTTEQLQASTLKAAVWTVYYYTSSTYNRVADRTTARFYWGTTTYNSRIQDLQFN